MKITSVLMLEFFFNSVKGLRTEASSYWKSRKKIRFSPRDSPTVLKKKFKKFECRGLSHHQKSHPCYGGNPLLCLRAHRRRRNRLSGWSVFTLCSNVTAALNIRKSNHIEYLNNEVSSWTTKMFLLDPL